MPVLTGKPLDREIWEGDGQRISREPGDQLVAVVFVQPGCAGRAGIPAATTGSRRDRVVRCCRLLRTSVVRSHVSVFVRLMRGSILILFLSGLAPESFAATLVAVVSERNADGLA